MDFSLTESAKEEPPVITAAVPSPLPQIVEAPVTKLPMPVNPDIPSKSDTTEKRRGRPKKLEFEKREVKPQIWIPQEEEYKAIRELAELGWSGPQIAEALKVSSQQFAGALVRLPRVKQEFEIGVENGKNFAEKRANWRPTPRDIDEIKYYASTGLRDAEIASKLGVSRSAFLARMNDTPQLQAAYEQGNGEYRADLIKDSNYLLDTRSEDLRNVGGLLNFKLKAYCELSDKPEAMQKIEIQGEVKHTHSLDAPPVQKTIDLAAFAAAEMARADKQSEEQMKIIEVKAKEIKEDY